jgi:hypothetical protein
MVCGVAAESLGEEWGERVRVSLRLFLLISPYIYREGLEILSSRLFPILNLDEFCPTTVHANTHAMVPMGPIGAF